MALDSRSSTMKFYVLTLHTFQLLASSPFGLCDRAGINPGLGLHRKLRLLQIGSTSPENSYPNGIYTSPPLLSGAVPPPTLGNSPNPYGIFTPSPPTPSGAMPPPLQSASPPSPSPPTPSGAMPPPLQSASPPSPSPPTPSGAMPPPLLSISPPPPSPPTPSGAVPPPLLSISPPPPSPNAQSPQHNAPKRLPAVNQPPPNSHSSPTPPPPAPNQKPENAVWCVAKPTVPADLIQQALDYACGSGAGCDAIQPNGACYQPATLLSHASYAFNSYWQKKKQGGGTCDFGGTAMLVTVDPSYDQCRFTCN